LLVRAIFWHDVYILHVQNLEDSVKLNEVDFKPNIDNLTLAVISTNKEADELENYGYEFRLCPTTWNVNLEVYKKRLDQGTIAFCTFVGQELAAILWVIPNQQTHDRIGTFPQKVNYSNNEVSGRGAWSNPKYREMGLLKYNAFFNRDPFLLRKGITVVRYGGPTWNIVGHSLVTNGLGAIPYAKAHHTKIFWWKFWKEIPINDK
jgi:hypothetical protein